MESLLDEYEVLSLQTGITVEKGHNFWSDRWIAMKVLQSFPEAVFIVLPMESLIVEEEALRSQTRITGENCHNIWSNRWIALKVWQ